MVDEAEEVVQRKGRGKKVVSSATGRTHRHKRTSLVKLAQMGKQANKATAAAAGASAFKRKLAKKKSMSLPSSSGPSSNDDGGGGGGDGNGDGDVNAEARPRRGTAVVPF